MIYIVSMITKQTLIDKGLEEPKGKVFNPYSRSYCKLWSVGDFNIRLTSKGNIQIFDSSYGDLLKTIKEEKVLDAFIIFAQSK